MLKISAISLILLFVFGCNSSSSKNSNLTSPQNHEVRLIKLTESQVKSMTKKQRELLVTAEEDIQQILKGSKPTHAKMSAAAADGGSLWFKCDEYSITSWKSLAGC